MQILELFDKKAPWSEVKYLGGIAPFAEAMFSIDEDIFEVIIHMHSPDERIADVSFSKRRPGRFLGDYGITGTGNEYLVFATVIDIVQHYVDKMQLNGINFGANESSRAKMYKALIARLCKQNDWVAEPFSLSREFLVKRKDNHV